MKTVVPKDGPWKGQILTILTFQPIAKVRAELEELQQRTRLSKSDLVNRAITFYEFLDSRWRDGGDFLFRDPVTGETETVRVVEADTWNAYTRKQEPAFPVGGLTGALATAGVTTLVILALVRRYRKKTKAL